MTPHLSATKVEGVKMQYLVGIVAVLIIIGLMIQYWYIALLLASAWIAPRIVRHIRMKRYFASEGFLAHKAAIADVAQRQRLQFNP